MAKSKLHQKMRAPKARAEQPVSAGIKRGAARAGIESKSDQRGGMSPRDWDRAIARAEEQGGPLYADMARLSQRFDKEFGGIGHAVATSLTLLQVAGCSARTPLEVHLLLSRCIGSLIKVQLDMRIEEAAPKRLATLDGGAS